MVNAESGDPVKKLVVVLSEEISQCRYSRSVVVIQVGTYFQDTVADQQLLHARFLAAVAHKTGTCAIELHQKQCNRDSVGQSSEQTVHRGVTHNKTRSSWRQHPWLHNLQATP